ncbi:MAG: acyl carrier protein [Candidatus Wallbacteria bacterium]|nr:acyl carrier protein [Candidatus Wallbacteria bacterium]
MTEIEIAAKVRALVCKQLDVPSQMVTDQASFVTDLGADSLDTVELAMSLEECFGIEIEETESKRLRTVRDAIEFVLEKQALPVAA